MCRMLSHDKIMFVVLVGGGMKGKKRGMAWSSARREMLRQMIMSGASVAEVAKKLRCSVPMAYDTARTYFGGIQALRSGHVWTLNQVIQMFSVTPEIGIAWIDAGLLVANRNQAWQSIDQTGQRPRQEYLITVAALWVFIRNRAGWMSWEIKDIRSQEWRDRAAQVRYAVNGRWLRIIEVAAQIPGYGLDTICDWLRNDRLPGIKWRNAWYVWSDDLIGFVPPAECVDFMARAQVRKSNQEQRS